MSGLIKMRPEWAETGLRSMIDYINEFSPTKEMRLIEIGSYAGESTRIFCENFKEVLSIDPFINDYDVNDPACHNMKLTDVYNVFLLNTNDLLNLTHIRKTSDDAVADLSDLTFDVVYIDGLHTYDQVKKDIQNYKINISNGGFISGHDYHTNWVGVINAVDECFGKPDNVFGDTSWIKRII
jgi:hypothetical protein